MLGANFTVYQELKELALRVQDVPELPSPQSVVIGLISGACGPFSNAPFDTIKIRAHLYHPLFSLHTDFAP